MNIFVASWIALTFTLELVSGLRESRNFKEPAFELASNITLITVMLPPILYLYYLIIKFFI